MWLMVGARYLYVSALKMKLDLSTGASIFAWR